LAELLRAFVGRTPRSAADAPVGLGSTRFWAVDKLFHGLRRLFLRPGRGLVEPGTDAAGLFTVHLAFAALLVFEVKFPNATSWLSGTGIRSLRRFLLQGGWRC